MTSSQDIRTIQLPVTAMHLGYEDCPSFLSLCKAQDAADEGDIINLDMDMIYNAPGQYAQPRPIQYFRIRNRNGTGTHMTGYKDLDEGVRPLAAQAIAEIQSSTGVMAPLQRLAERHGSDLSGPPDTVDLEMEFSLCPAGALYFWSLYADYGILQDHLRTISETNIAAGLCLIGRRCTGRHQALEQAETLYRFADMVLEERVIQCVSKPDIEITLPDISRIAAALLGYDTGAISR